MGQFGKADIFPLLYSGYIPPQNLASVALYLTCPFPEELNLLPRFSFLAMKSPGSSTDADVLHHTQRQLTVPMFFILPALALRNTTLRRPCCADPHP